VVGVSRSGTTLLRLMLDAHPQLTIPPETHFVPRVVNVCERLVAEGAPTAEIRAHALEAMTTHPRWGDFGVSAQEVRELMERHDPLTPGDAVRSFYEAYAAKQGKPRWGDKSPPYTWKSLRIQRALPEAHFVHIIRDGRDVALSLSEVSWGPGDVTLAAEKWVTELRRARKRARGLAHGTYMELRYEDLVARPRKVIDGVADYLGSPVSKVVLADVDDHGVGTWRDRLTRKQVTQVERIAGTELRRLGYQPSTG
jgi:hypothetical protein